MNYRIMLMNRTQIVAILADVPLEATNFTITGPSNTYSSLAPPIRTQIYKSLESMLLQLQRWPRQTTPTLISRFWKFWIDTDRSLISFRVFFWTSTRPQVRLAEIWTSFFQRELLLVILKQSRFVVYIVCLLASQRNIFRRSDCKIQVLTWQASRRVRLRSRG